MNKSAVLKVRIEPELKQQSMHQAVKAGLPLSEYVRRALLAGLAVKGVTDGAQK